MKFRIYRNNPDIDKRPYMQCVARMKRSGIRGQNSE